MTTTNKIMLKETTKMSLHERFTVYRKQNEVQQQVRQAEFTLGAGADISSPVVSVLHQQRQQQQRVQKAASQRNKRLALQLANRPSVLAALKIKKKSLRQRLGQNFEGGSQMRAGSVKSRLSLQPFGIRGRLGGYQGGNTTRMINNRGGRGMGGRTGRYIRGGANTRVSGTSPMLKGRLGTGTTGPRTRGFSPNKRSAFKRGRGLMRGSFIRGGFSRGGFKQQQFRGQANRGRARNTGGNRGSRGGNNRSRGRGARRGNWQGPATNNTNNNGNSRIGQIRGRFPSKQDLDNDLDEYMAKTKSHLDAELDAYMAQAE